MMQALVGRSFVLKRTSLAHIQRRMRSLATTAELAPRTFAHYVIYKGKGALQLTPIASTFTAAGGAGSAGLPAGQAVDRVGGVLLEFAPSKGDKVYDWQAREGAPAGALAGGCAARTRPPRMHSHISVATQNKQTFSLSVNELGDFLAAHAAGFSSSASELKFVHDPGVGTSTARQVIKNLSFVDTKDGKGAVYASINVTGPEPARVSVPVSAGELEVMAAIFRFSIPRLLGVDRLF